MPIATRALLLSVSVALCATFVGCSLGTPAPTQRPTPRPYPQSCVADAASDQILVNVPAVSNIFGAGHAMPPEPGGGGAGELPPVVELAESVQELAFPCVAGLMNCCTGPPDTTAEADLRWKSDISSHNGIAGISHRNAGAFLVGVFLTDEEPADPAPERLDVTELCPVFCLFDVVAPELAQPFFIASGGPSRYTLPESATRLFVGIADALGVTGPPGYYGNNSGEFQVVVDTAP